MKQQILLLVLILSIFGCGEEEGNPDVKSLTISTKAINTITQLTAVSGGNIEHDGGNTVVARGVCWSESTGPTLTDNLTEDGEGVGVFNSLLTGLVANTTYYLRAYATSSEGTFYGNEISFTTKKEPEVYYEGDLFLETQEEVDNFGIQGYTAVKGSITIGNFDVPSTSIINLEPLTHLHSVERDLLICNNSALPNVNGLSNLSSIGGRLAMWDNPSIANIDSLINLTLVGEVEIYNNDALVNIDGLMNLFSTNLLIIDSNLSLTNIDALKKVTSCGFLSIVDNGSLANVDGLSNISSVRGNLFIWNNDALTNIDGLRKLRSISKSLLISHNAVLTNVDGLSNLSSIGLFDEFGIGYSGDLNIEANDALTNLDGLSNVIFVALNVDISNNDVLADFCGLQTLAISDDYRGYDASMNAFNPSMTDIADGNCSQ